MSISVFIDGNVWNFLFDRNLDLSVELPSDEFILCHTREAEFEIPVGKPELDKFIEATINRCNIKTDSYFGFSDETRPPSEQRFGGFDVGRFATPEEIDFISRHRASQIERPTKLQKNEADIALAARSLHSVVLTLDQKSVPMKNASKQGGRVVYLNDFGHQKLPLAVFIKSRI